MEAIKLNTVIKKDGEIKVTGVPCVKGQKVEMVIMFEKDDKKEEKHFTTRDLLKSDIIGIWKDRDDITDSSAFARELREKALSRDIDL